MSSGESEAYDLCIVGAGPHALAVLSALHSPFATLTEHESSHVHAGMKSRNKAPSICVVDAHGEWLHEWRSRFCALGIDYLRSPTLAHPDLSDEHALYSFAKREGRLNELFDVSGGLTQFDGLWELDIGAFQVPGSQLFVDFCADLSASLPQTLLKGYVSDVERLEGSEPIYKVHFESNTTISKRASRSVEAKRVVLALGASGRPMIPKPILPLQATHASMIIHTHEFDRLAEANITSNSQILVIGGGLSAVQAVILAVKRGAKHVVLCSRRPLVSQEYDIPLSWVDRRTERRHFFDFYSTPLEERLSLVKQIRGGGSVPSAYLKELEKLTKHGSVTHRVGSLNSIHPLTSSSCGDRLQAFLPSFGDDQPSESIGLFDFIILGTGSQHDVGGIPLCRNLIHRFNLPVCDNLPVLDANLRWGETENLAVVGAMATLEVGPDAGNITAARRTAIRYTSDTLEEIWKEWEESGTKEDASTFSTSGAALMRQNPFSLLQVSDDDESDDEDIEESEEFIDTDSDQ